MGLFGGSSSSSSSLTNTLAFNPVINIGDDNKADTRAEQRASSTASAEAKDEFGLSASVGVGLGGSGSGGDASLARKGDEQPMQVAPAKNDVFSLSKLGTSNTYLYVVGGIVLIGGIYFISKKKKKN